MATCRFCKKYDREDEHGLQCISYGVRANAHPDCLLKAKGAGAFDLLHDWQLMNFPVFAAKRAGLLDELTARCDALRKQAG